MNARQRYAQAMEWLYIGCIVLSGAALVVITPTPRFLSAPDGEYGIDAELLDRYDRESRKDATALRDEFAALLLVGDARRQTAARQLRELRRNAPAPRPDALAAGLSIYGANHD